MDILAGIIGIMVSQVGIQVGKLLFFGILLQVRNFGSFRIMLGLVSVVVSDPVAGLSVKGFVQGLCLASLYPERLTVG